MKATTGVKRRYPQALLMSLVLLAALATGIGSARAESPISPAEPPPSLQAVPHDLLPEIPDPYGFVTVEVGDHFSCDIPPDWSRIHGSGFGLTDEEKRTYGIKLEAPSTSEVPATISIFYYAEGSLMYKSVDHYLRAFSQSAPAEGARDGHDYGKITPVTVSGREAMTFESIGMRSITSGTSVSSQPGVYFRPGLNAERVPIRERFVVLPAPPGFFALRYTAPEKTFQEFLPVFEQVTKRFYPWR